MNASAFPRDRTNTNIRKYLKSIGRSGDRFSSPQALRLSFELLTFDQDAENNHIIVLYDKGYAGTSLKTDYAQP
ncbi:hypothetical protein [Agrobacterium tumefaciens]|uniref:hypothetical protein n=1 Tax=Agrobacterium tumefaciens TaxID=358 RepID=UPI0021CEE714|nr:hypothetical protein [Agrobacterium tumefaciens]